MLGSAILNHNHPSGSVAFKFLVLYHLEIEKRKESDVVSSNQNPYVSSLLLMHRVGQGSGGDGILGFQLLK